MAKTCGLFSALMVRGKQKQNISEDAERKTYTTNTRSMKK